MSTSDLLPLHTKYEIILYKANKDNTAVLNKSIFEFLVLFLFYAIKKDLTGLKVEYRFTHLFGKKYLLKKYIDDGKKCDTKIIQLNRN
jgi:hypothetical protein